MVPASISGGDARPDRGGPALESGALDAVSIDGVIDCLAELKLMKPVRFGRIDERFTGLGVLARVQVEAHPVAVETDPETHQIRFPRLLHRRGFPEMVGGELHEDVEFPCLELLPLQIEILDQQDHHLVEIGQSLTSGILFPVVGVALVDDLLAGDVVLQHEGTAADQILRRSIGCHLLQQGRVLILQMILPLVVRDQPHIADVGHELGIDAR